MRTVLFFIFIAIFLTSCANIQPTNDEIMNAYYGNKPKDANSAINEKLERMFIASDFMVLGCDEPTKKWVNNLGNIYYGWDVHCSIVRKNMLGYRIFRMHFLFNNETIISKTGDLDSDWSNEGLVDHDVPLQFKGFALKPPQNIKWSILGKTKDSISFIRQSENESHSIIAFVSTFKTLQPVDNIGDLKSYVVEQLKIDNESNRYKESDIKISEQLFHGQTAILASGYTDDLKVPNEPNQIYRMMFTSIYVLPPSSNGNTVLVIGYSQRLPNGKEFVNIEEEIQSFLDSITFN